MCRSHHRAANGASARVRAAAIRTHHSMKHITLLAALGAASLTSLATAQGPFRPVTSLGLGGLAEIVDATGDGQTLVYTDSDTGALGIVDLGNPAMPVVTGSVAMPGEPTSVSILGDLAVATVWVDKPTEGAPPPAFLPGALVVVDLAVPSAPVVLGRVDVGYHPDSVKLTRVGRRLVAVLAIENEPVVVENGVVTGDDVAGDPNDQSPPGLIQVVTLDRSNIAGSTVVDVVLDQATLSAAGLEFADDPQPEFVTVQGTTAAVSLQENNGIAIVDIQDPRAPQLVRVFALGSATERSADLTEDDAISFAEGYPSTAPNPVDAAGNPLPQGQRFPDAIAFHPRHGVIYSADEGEFDFTGGRGASAWRVDGTQVWDDGGLIERVAVALGQYPEGRSANKGVEMEGVTTASFGRRDYAFVLSERGSFMAVFDVTRADRPRFEQLLPTGVSPEGVVAIPDRGLVVTADEGSGTLTVFEHDRRYRPAPDQPLLYSSGVDAPWSALSGATAAPLFRFPGFEHILRWLPARLRAHVLAADLYAVPDNALPTTIFRIDIGGSFARVSTELPVTRGGIQARYDGEGLVRDSSILGDGAGFFIASEGDAASLPNLVVQVDWRGEVVREIQLPHAVDPAADPAIGGAAQGAAGGAPIRSNGFEGVTLSDDGRYLLVAIQRQFDGEAAVGGAFHTRIARYDLGQIRRGTAPHAGIRFGGDWEFFFYGLENVPQGWSGLSEIINLGRGRYAVIERDNQISTDSVLKKVYAFSLRGLSPDADGVPDASDTVTKVELRDVLAEFAPYEKIECLAVTAEGSLWVGLDNDGGAVESRFLNTGAGR